MNIGWIGTGVMGRAMAGHLLDAGHHVFVFNRTREKAQALLDRGATWRDSPAELAGACEAVCVMVGYPSEVREVVLAPHGVLAAMSAGSLLIDFTTSSPALAAEIAQAAAKRGIDAIDAPVSGGDVGARQAALSIMVGGSEGAYRRAMPILEKLGKTIVHQGKPGSGQHTKMVNQILIASGMVALCEGLIYARAAGLDAEKMLSSVSGGAAASWSLSNYAPRVLKGDLAPGFYVEHFLKDMKIALDEAERMKLCLPGLAQAKQLYTMLSAMGGARNGTHSLIKVFETLSNRPGPGTLAESSIAP